MLEGTLVHDKMLLAVARFGQQFAGYVRNTSSVNTSWLEHRTHHTGLHEAKACKTAKI